MFTGLVDLSILLPLRPPGVLDLDRSRVDFESLSPLPLSREDSRFRSETGLVTVREENGARGSRSTHPGIGKPLLRASCWAAR